ncbi:tetratricopeptide repeat protein [Dactylosporangium sp. NPDC050588]|uniref:tetratricopeptide repeat protein n=1 Tax=Dactylosporangium sp. NPDC050588 TaxID=3157211 RepID=UPI0034108105
MSDWSRLFTGWQKTTASQAVIGSLAFGPVIQLSDVAGAVTLTINSRAPLTYQIKEFQAEAQKLPQSSARAQPSRLLLPRYRVVPFTGREQQVHDLAEWAESDAPTVRLIHSAGGQGKTRLADEFAALCSATGWTVWRAVHTTTPGATASGVPATTALGLDAPASRVNLLTDGRVLVVVDYADRWPASHLLALLTDLHAIAARTPFVLRVLLLARSSGFWWQAVADRLDSDLGMSADDSVLPPLGLNQNRDDLYGAAAQHFATALGVNDNSVWSAPPGLEQPGFAQVLAVHMAALAAVEAYRHGDATPTAPHAISAYLLRREYAHWQHLHTRAEDPMRTRPEVMHRVTFVATLTGALPRLTARAAIFRVDLAANVPDADQLIDDHRACVPPADPATVFEALHPDRLGEDLIALCTPGHPHANTGGLVDDWAIAAPAALLSAADNVPSAWTATALTVLVETAQRWPHIATNVLYPFVRQHPSIALAAGGTTLTRLADLPHVDPTALEAIAALLPGNRHIDLDPAAAAITTTLAHHRLTTSSDPVIHAEIHANHAWRLSNAGRRDEALAAAEKALDIRRQLAEADPAHLPGLAELLINLGTFLSEVGKRKEAVPAAHEAIGIFRRLVETDPDAYQPGLATALTNLGMFLSDEGLRKEALAPVEEAVAIRRRLSKADPAAYEPSLAVSLMNLGAHLSELGQQDAAFAAATEAIDIHRRLADTEPTVYLPDLAMSLNNLGGHLFRLGQRSAALAPAEEAVAIRRRLSKNNPAAYQPDLAMSLNNLGSYLAELGHQDLALVAAEEAVGIYRRLAETNSAAYQPALAAALNNLGGHLAELGRRNEALSMIEEAVAIRRRLSGTNNAAHQPDLATALNNLGMLKSKLGKRDEALASTAEATRIYRQLAEGNSAAYLPNLSASLNNLSNHLAELGRHDEALTAVEKAVDIRRQLAEVNPDAYQADLAASLNNLGSRLSALGQREEALHPVKEATGIYRRLTEGNPAAYQPDLAASLNNLGNRLSALGLWEEGLAAAKEALDIRRQLADANPGAHLLALAGSLHNLGNHLSGLGRWEDALTAAEEAVGIFRALALLDPAAYQASLAMSLRSYARACVKAREGKPDALDAITEAIDIFGVLAEQLPQIFGRKLLAAFTTLADVLTALGRTEEANDLRRQLEEASHRSVNSNDDRLRRA